LTKGLRCDIITERQKALFGFFVDSVEEKKKSKKIKKSS